MDGVLVNSDRLEALIAEASASGGAERANYQLFVVRLCEALGLEARDMAREQNSLNDYVFGRRVDGWEDLAPALVGKPGATLPSPHKSPEQERAEEELLARLVALNQERAAAEKRGQVRWLRPDYQIPRLGARVPKPLAEELALPEIELPESESRQKWPADGLEQIRLVRDLLAKAPAPVPPDAILGTLAGRTTAKRRERVAEVLETLVATGIARHGEEEGQKGYFLPR